MPVRLDIADHVARVTLDRPEKLNAVDAATEAELEAIWQRLEKDRDVRAVILTGAGDRAFCAGADLGDGTAKSGLDYWTTPRPHGFGGISFRDTLDIPVIGRINGHALGGGFEMVLGCDIVIAAEEATFGLTEPRVGYIPLDGGMVQLQRQIPFHLAMGFLLTAKRFKARELADWGLINEVVPRAELDVAVQRWLDDVLACAPLSLRAIKQVVRRSGHLQPREAQMLRLPALIEALRSEDGAEGVRAFREKRKPEWKGR
jgi:crotonobetainyl-CoA hydratase